MIDRGAAALLLLLVASPSGCATFSGVRPRFGPVAGSVLADLAAPPDSVIRELDAAVRGAGVPVRILSPREGYLESGWFDAATRVAHQPRPGRLDAVVKLRFFADPVAGRTRLLAECVRRVMVDPSLPERELERMVPDDHRGRAVLDSVLARVVPRDTTQERVAPRDTTQRRVAPRDTSRLRVAPRDSTREERR